MRRIEISEKELTKHIDKVLVKNHILNESFNDWCENLDPHENPDIDNHQAFLEDVAIVMAESINGS